MPNWRYKNKEFIEVSQFPIDCFGFVYQITLSINGVYHHYIGKKQLYSKRKFKFGKKIIAAFTDKRTKKWEYRLTETDWKVYNSSSKYVQELIKTGTKIVNKQILLFAYSDLELKYLEAKEMMINSSLTDIKYLNAGFSFKCIGKLKF